MINLAIPADDKYWFQALVTASSAVRGSSEPVRVFILDGGISADHRAVMGAHFTEMRPRGERAPSSSVSFIPLDRAKLARYGEWHGSSVAWSRIWLADLLPDDVDWVISSDADILFRGDIAALWNLRDEKYVFQGSRDSLPPWVPRNPEIGPWCDAHGFDYGDPDKFICVGLTMLNLKRVRSEGWRRKLEEFVEKHHDAPYLDQTALNLVFASCKAVLPRNWGCFSGDANADVDYGGNCAIHYVNDQPWRRRKLTHLVSEVVLLWWEESDRIFQKVSDTSRQLSSLAADIRTPCGCRNWLDYAWRRFVWVFLHATRFLWRHSRRLSWNFRNAARDV